MKGALAGILVLALAGLGLWLRSSRRVAEPPPAVAPAPAPAPVGPRASDPLEGILRAATAAPEGPLTDKPVDKPLHKLSRFPPRTRIPVAKLPKVTRGIPMPDGSFLPFLNGMTHAPPIHRDPSLGPVPPVVELVVDDGGFEWWVHADGSSTTSRYAQVTANGKTYWDPSSAHNAHNPMDRLRPAEPKGGEEK